ncbi:MAG: hypothetical protein GXO78_08150 [Calditrichaeota bacterium]|nr:hypothetical protein [Calditrichota bacterium]
MKSAWKMGWVFLLLGISLALAQIPRAISYQGILTDVNGTPVADGAYELTFRLYDALSNGNMLWEEKQTVPVKDGLFNVALGSVTPLVLPFDQPYWLGITVGSGTEMSPRIPLAASPYSLNAQSVADSVITGEKVADGQLVRSVNGLTDNVTLAAGTNVSLTQTGQTITISATGGGDGGNTLDEAYDQGGPGAGRRIVADAGAVEIDGTGGLKVAGSVGIGSDALTEKVRIEGTDSLGTDDGFTVARIRFTRSVPDNIALRNTRALEVYSVYGSPSGTYYAPRAVQAIVENNSSAGTITEASGFYSVVKNTGGGGTIEIANGLYSIISNHAGGLIKEARGVFIASPRAFGTIENNYGLFVENQKIPGTRTYGIYVEGGMSYFADSVGIGTDKPRGHLHLSSNGDTKLRFTNGHDNDVAIVYNTDNDALEFRLGGTGTETMFVITDGGNVGIGNANPSNILTVAQGSITDPIADGWTTYSSRRWKTNIHTIEGALEKVRQLRGVTFNWKSTGKPDIGLIAEEVGKVIPEVVTYEENGRDARSVDYARLVALLIEAVKTQQRQIEEQQAAIRMLVERMNAMEKTYRVTRGE